MKQQYYFFLLLLLISISFHLNAQKALPSFQLKAITKGRNLISWVNPYKNCIKLSVQRSTNQQTFKTLIWARNPNLSENEYIDNKASTDSILYYRIFYVLKGGNYFFSTIMSTADFPPSGSNSLSKETTNPTQPYLSSIDYKPSKYVFITNGSVYIHLPEAKQHQYQIIFYEENGVEVFRLSQLKETELYIDKSNFIHAGWFGFELYEDNTIKEKNKILVRVN